MKEKGSPLPDLSPWRPSHRCNVMRQPCLAIFDPSSVHRCSHYMCSSFWSSFLPNMLQKSSTTTSLSKINIRCKSGFHFVLDRCLIIGFQTITFNICFLRAFVQSMLAPPCIRFETNHALISHPKSWTTKYLHIPSYNPNIPPYNFIFPDILQNI